MNTPTAVVFHWKDNRFEKIKTIETTDERIFEVLTKETHYPLSFCYQYNITDSKGNVATLDSYNNCLFD